MSLIMYGLGVVFYESRTQFNGKTEFRGIADVRNDKAYDRMDCKYCYTDDVQPLTLYEYVEQNPTGQAICPNCQAGLTPPVEVPASLPGLVKSIRDHHEKTTGELRILPREGTTGSR